MKDKMDLVSVVQLLNQALRLEYSLIIHYPRLASVLRDAETKELALQLGSASIKHADVVANTIQQLGGTPDWSFEPFPEDTDLVRIFQTQLEKEKLARRLHRQSAGLVPGSLRDQLAELAGEEESHIKIVEDILSRLPTGDGASACLRLRNHQFATGGLRPRNFPCCLVNKPSSMLTLI